MKIRNCAIWVLLAVLLWTLAVPALAGVVDPVGPDEPQITAVKASQITATRLVMIKNLDLELDIPLLSLEAIEGEGYELSIHGSGKLSVNNNSGAAIRVKSLAIASGTVSAVGSTEGIDADDEIQISGQSSVDAVSWNSGNGMSCRTGNIYITGGTVNAWGGFNGIYAKQGQVVVGGSAVVNAWGSTSGGGNGAVGGAGIRGTGGVILNNGRVTAIGKGGSGKDYESGIYSEQGSIIINGGVVEASGFYGIRAESSTESITITGGSVTAEATWGVEGFGSGLRAGGYVVLRPGARLDASGWDYGVCADSGWVMLNGIATIEGKGDDGVYAAMNVTVNGEQVKVTGDEHGLCSNQMNVLVAGNLNVMGAKGDGIYAKGGVSIRAGKVTVYGGRHGVYADTGAISLTDGNIEAIGTLGNRAFYCPNALLSVAENYFAHHEYNGLDTQLIPGEHSFYLGSNEWASACSVFFKNPGADALSDSQIDEILAYFGKTNVLKLPAGTRTIKAEAFKGVKADAVVIPKSVNPIEEGAFDGTDIVIYGYTASYARTFANRYGIPFVSMDDMYSIVTH